MFVFLSQSSSECWCRLISLWNFLLVERKKFPNYLIQQITSFYTLIYLYFYVYGCFIANQVINFSSVCEIGNIVPYFFGQKNFENLQNISAFVGAAVVNRFSFPDTYEPPDVDASVSFQTGSGLLAVVTASFTFNLPHSIPSATAHTLAPCG